MIRVIILAFIIYTVLTWLRDAGFIPLLGPGDGPFILVISMIASIGMLGLLSSRKASA